MCCIHLQQPGERETCATATSCESDHTVTDVLHEYRYTTIRREGDLPDTEEEAHGSSSTLRSCYGEVHWLLQEAEFQLIRLKGVTTHQIDRKGRPGQ